MTYQCTICGTNSEASEFYSKVTTRCKECHKKKVRENRAANVERYRAYDAARFKNDPRVLERHKKYKTTQNGKASMNAARQKWLESNSDKRAAHVILGNAVRSGKMEKPNTCQVCGVAGHRIHGHHNDYSLPLSVLWCCSKCHTEIHKKMEAR